jgi:hypothetical protein
MGAHDQSPRIRFRDSILDRLLQRELLDVLHLDVHRPDRLRHRVDGSRDPRRSLRAQHGRVGRSGSRSTRVVLVAKVNAGVRDALRVADREEVSVVEIVESEVDVEIVARERVSLLRRVKL